MDHSCTGRMGEGQRSPASSAQGQVHPSRPHVHSYPSTAELTFQLTLSGVERR